MIPRELWVGSPQTALPPNGVQGMHAKCAMLNASNRKILSFTCLSALPAVAETGG